MFRAENDIQDVSEHSRERENIILHCTNISILYLLRFNTLINRNNIICNETCATIFCSSSSILQRRRDPSCATWASTLRAIASIACRPRRSEFENVSRNFDLGDRYMSHIDRSRRERKKNDEQLSLSVAPTMPSSSALGWRIEWMGTSDLSVARGEPSKRKYSSGRGGCII